MNKGAGSIDTRPYAGKLKLNQKRAEAHQCLELQRTCGVLFIHELLYDRSGPDCLLPMGRSRHHADKASSLALVSGVEPTHLSYHSRLLGVLSLAPVRLKGCRGKFMDICEQLVPTPRCTFLNFSFSLLQTTLRPTLWRPVIADTFEQIAQS